MGKWKNIWSWKPKGIMKVCVAVSHQRMRYKMLVLATKEFSLWSPQQLEYIHFDWYACGIQALSPLLTHYSVSFSIKCTWFLVFFFWVSPPLLLLIIINVIVKRKKGKKKEEKDGYNLITQMNDRYVVLVYSLKSM